MRTHVQTLTAALIACGLAGAAPAASLGGATLPDTYPAVGQTLVLNGTGLRTLTIFNVKVYVAGLYLAKPSHEAAEILGSTTPKVLVLQFLHTGTKAEVEAQFREGEQNNCGAGQCAPEDKPVFDALLRDIPAVAVGDTFTFILDGGGTVLVNNRAISRFTSRSLTRQLLAGFIGDHPPSTDLRQHLLGLAR